MKAILRIKSRRNYKLLAEYLEEIGVHVVDSGDCDIFIVDLPSYDENEILEVKRKASPIFLPVLLLTTRDDIGLATKHLWKVVDDIIRIPIEKVELAAKIVTLIRAREYSIKLNESLEAVKVVSSIIRHDILNDLTVAIGYLEIGEEKEKVLDKLQHIAERLEKFRRYEKLAEIRELRCISIKDAVEDSMRLKPDLVVNVGNYCAMADNMLSAVIYNIVSNAVKHCGSDVNVRIEAGERGDWIEIRIIDDGKGIPDEIKEKVFEEGFKHESAGSGLGLFLAKKVIERYGGKISVEDNEPRGTVFKILLKKC